MKGVYPNIYEFIWLLIYRHCLRLFCTSRCPETEAEIETDTDTRGLSSIWLEEMGLFAQDKLELIKENRCLIQLFQAYFTLLTIARSIHREIRFRSAKQISKNRASYLLFGRGTLATLLVIHMGIGVALTYSYQAVSGDFSFAASFVAAISYLGLAYCVFQARALPLFKTTLFALIALTSFGSFFSSLWQKHIGTTCYSEVCILIDPNGDFQITTVKILMITFWSLFLLLISIKNPIVDYLVSKQSINRTL